MWQRLALFLFKKSTSSINGVAIFLIAMNVLCNVIASLFFQNFSIFFLSKFAYK